MDKRKTASWPTTSRSGSKKDGLYIKKLGENNLEYIRGYENACLDYNLIDDHTLRFLHNLFDAEAKHHFKKKFRTFSNHAVFLKLS